MSFASDKLYNGYLRRNLPTIVSRVKVREIVVHLPCLTSHDRETIEAKRETNGNFDGMMLLLDCLKRRENWPEQLIDALEACEHTTIAAEMRAEYNALMGTDNSNTRSPPTTVVRAHVHPTPSARDENGGNNQATVAPPVAGAPPTVEISTQPQAPQSPAEQAPKAASPPEPVPDPPQSAQIEVPPPPSTPPPSPEIAHTQVNEAALPPTEINSHQEPEENSEPDVQVISGDAAVGSENDEVSVNSVTTPQPVETDTPSCADSLQTTVNTEDEPPQSRSPTQMNSSDGPSFPILTPEKPPIQDTTPPIDKTSTPVLQPEDISEPPAAQAESSPLTEIAANSSPEPVAAAIDINLNEDNSLCLSKPGNLHSVLPQDHTSPTIPAPSSPVEPYSGNSERLEISEDAPHTVTSAHVPVCSGMNTVTAPPCQENGFATTHNEPEENHYESPCDSLETQEVLENVIQVTEQPSILNLDGQTTPLQAQIVNGELAKDTISASPSATAGDTITSSKPSEPAASEAARQTPLIQSVNTKYILTAAGVGACALLVAWRFKH